MFIFRLLIKLLEVYSLLVIVKLALPFFYKKQNRWTVILDKICAPILTLGRLAAAKVLQGRRLMFDAAPFAALIILWLLTFILSIFF